MASRRLNVKKRFSEEQIIGFLREADSGLAIEELCRRHGCSEASFYLWRSKCQPGFLTDRRISEDKTSGPIEREKQHVRIQAHLWAKFGLACCLLASSAVADERAQESVGYRNALVQAGQQGSIPVLVTLNSTFRLEALLSPAERQSQRTSVKTAQAAFGAALIGDLFQAAL
jgi:transposase-like protein